MTKNSSKLLENLDRESQDYALELYKNTLLEATKPNWKLDFWKSV